MLRRCFLRSHKKRHTQTQQLGDDFGMVQRRGGELEREWVERVEESSSGAVAAAVVAAVAAVVALSVPLGRGGDKAAKLDNIHAVGGSRGAPATSSAARIEII